MVREIEPGFHGNASSTSSVYSDFVDSRSPSPLSSGQGLYVEGNSDMDTDPTSNNSRAPSIFSYNSSRDGTEMLKVENGRTFNNQSDTYYLPADEPEFERLGLQHKIHCAVLGGLYPGIEEVERALTPEWGVEKAILDVGTGPGHWAIDMAKKFPHCHVVGVDLAPRTSFPVLPDNLRLEFDDANLGFPHYHGCFDVVHSRSISNGTWEWSGDSLPRILQYASIMKSGPFIWLAMCNDIHDYDEYVVELVRCLRPGGVLILVDGEPPVLSGAKLPQQPAWVHGTYPETKGWMARILYEASKGMVARGGRVLTNAPAAIARALANTGSFPSQTVHTMHIPLGPWPVGATEAETKWIRMLGEMMRRNAFEFVHTLRPLVKTQGFSDEMIDKFIYGAQQELKDLSVPMYTRWAYAYAVKPALPQLHQHGGTDISAVP